jgi:hypothetical protein
MISARGDGMANTPTTPSIIRTMAAFLMLAIAICALKLASFVFCLRRCFSSASLETRFFLPPKIRFHHGIFLAATA